MSANHAVSPLAPKTTPTLPRIAGVKLGVARSGVRYKDRDDVLLAVVPAGATIAGVLTKSKTCSAPVDWCRKNLARGKVRAIVVNAGNANAFTGKVGDKAVEETTRSIAQALGCPRNEVFMASTGVIGQPLDWEKIAAVVPAHQVGQGRRLAGRRGRHHDHRHVPEAGDAPGQDRRAHGDGERVPEGLGHDRA